MNAGQPGWLTLAPVMFLCLWSGGYVVAKIGLEFAEPLTILALRYALVVLAMGALFLVLRPPVPKTSAGWLHLIVVGVLMQTVYFGMSYMAFGSGVAAGTVALIMSLQPILVALVAPFWASERVGWRCWIGLALGLTGTVIVILARLEVAAPPWIGFGFAVLGLAGIIIATLWEKRFRVSQHPVTANLIGFAAGLAGILPFALVLETQRIDWTWEFGAALSYLVIGNSLLAVSLLLAMIRAGAVSRVSSLFFLVPPLAALLAWVALDEAMPWLGWLGMAIAGAGVWIATRSEPSRV